mmetsp:Transcript_3668/g.7231  ORF Transcript_3668/g.7231 Transcript_3668/m.7231 type:complete len:179 (-) Transcript_3668:231-767(-)
MLESMFNAFLIRGGATPEMHVPQYYEKHKGSQDNVNSPPHPAKLAFAFAVYKHAALSAHKTLFNVPFLGVSLTTSKRRVPALLIIIDILSYGGKWVQLATLLFWHTLEKARRVTSHLCPVWASRRAYFIRADFPRIERLATSDIRSHVDMFLHDLDTALAWPDIHVVQDNSLFRRVAG